MTQAFSKTHQARDCILQWIMDGQFAPGEKLPSERELADELSVNHRTVRRGLAELQRQGVITKKPRVGNFVCEVRPRELTTEVAVVLPRYLYKDSVRQSVVSQVVGTLHQLLHQGRYAVTPLSFHPGQLKIEAGQVMLTRGITAALLWPDCYIQADHLEQLVDQGVRLVLIHNREPHLEHLDIPCVWADHQNVLRTILDRLLELGHRRVRAGMYTHHPQSRALSAAVRDAGAQLDTEAHRPTVFDIPNDFGEVDYLPILSRVLDEQPAPTAVVVPDEVAGAALLRLCYERNLRIPQDISIASLCDNTPKSHAVELTAGDSLGVIARALEQGTDILRSMIDGRSVDEPVRRIETQIHWGQSIAPPATRSSYTPDQQPQSMTL